MKKEIKKETKKEIKKVYEEPMLDVITFSTDVITVSGGEGGGGGLDITTPEDEF